MGPPPRDQDANQTATQGQDDHQDQVLHPNRPRQDGQSHARRRRGVDASQTDTKRRGLVETTAAAGRHAVSPSRVYRAAERQHPRCAAGGACFPARARRSLLVDAVAGAGAGHGGGGARPARGGGRRGRAGREARQTRQAAAHRRRADRGESRRRAGRSGAHARGVVTRSGARGQ